MFGIFGSLVYTGTFLFRVRFRQVSLQIVVVICLCKNPFLFKVLFRLYLMLGLYRNLFIQGSDKTAFTVIYNYCLDIIMTLC
jgi:hypothetical protein